MFLSLLTPATETETRSSVPHMVKLIRYLLDHREKRRLSGSSSVLQLSGDLTPEVIIHWTSNSFNIKHWVRRTAKVIGRLPMINPNKLNATKLLVDQKKNLFLIINFSLHKMLREAICIAKTHGTRFPFGFYYFNSSQIDIFKLTKLFLILICFSIMPSNLQQLRKIIIMVIFLK